MRRRIGLLDSGVGGLSILRELLKLKYDANFIYLADNANFPFGEKTNSEIDKIVKNGTKKLQNLGCETIILACNTATTVSFEKLRKKFPKIEIFGVKPLLNDAVRLTKTGKIVVFATFATLVSDYFQQIKNNIPQNIEIYTQASYQWVRLIEEGNFMPQLVMDQIKGYVANGVDTIILGSTHLAFLEEAVRLAAGSKINIIHPGIDTVNQLKRKFGKGSKPNSIQYYLTKKSKKFEELAAKIMKTKVFVKVLE